MKKISNFLLALCAFGFMILAYFCGELKYNTENHFNEMDSTISTLKSKVVKQVNRSNMMDSVHYRYCKWELVDSLKAIIE